MTVLVFVLLSILLSCLQGANTVDGNLPECYLLYDVNPGEGFNLRRDVYMRIASLNNKLNCTLVLPPWDHLYHWQSRELGFQGKALWSQFFDVKQLSLYTPVTELETFLEGDKTNSLLDMIIHLQHPKDINRNYADQARFVDCKSLKKFWKEEDGTYGGPFWSYEVIRGKRLKCMEVLGGPSAVAPPLSKFVQTKKARKIFLDRAETLLHDDYGQSNYWRARRSMRFARHLVTLANGFREQYLNSTDADDMTELPLDCTDEKMGRLEAIGGPYVAAHLRRKDFLVARKKNLPSLKSAAKTLSDLAEKLKLMKIFVASDASDEEINELESHLRPGLELFTFRPPLEVKREILDGGVAIVDQLICANARYFVGSFESTFSFRIQEEREIRHFRPETTFNRFCGDSESKCEQPTQWRIVY